MGIPRDLTRDDVIAAARDLAAGMPSGFGESRDYDVVIGGLRFAPKAVVGLAARRSLGRQLRPSEFSGGEGSGQANAVLKALGFEIVAVVRDARTWLFLQRLGRHGGNSGYPDIPGETYVYDANVQYHRQVAEGDVALVHDGQRLLGVGRIGLVTSFTAPKRRNRCPHCGVTNIASLSSGRHKCQRCFRDFDSPVVETLSEFPFYSAQYASYVQCELEVTTAELRAASTVSATQLSIRPVTRHALPQIVKLLIDAVEGRGYEVAPPPPLETTIAEGWVALGASHQAGATAPLHVGIELRTSLDALDRGTQRHIDTVDALAGFLRGRGIEPREAGSARVPFDLGWDFRGHLWVAEVKSLMQAVETQQIRLGLGQVLDYRQRLTSLGTVPACGLVVEREPAEPRWTDVCAGAGVVLAWPGAFDRLLSGDHRAA